jgi:hypothetical protein
VDRQGELYIQTKKEFSAKVEAAWKVASDVLLARY